MREPSPGWLLGSAGGRLLLSALLAASGRAPTRGRFRSAPLVARSLQRTVARLVAGARPAAGALGPDALALDPVPPRHSSQATPLAPCLPGVVPDHRFGLPTGSQRAHPESRSSAIVVRVLGPVAVEGPVAPLTTQQLSLLAYLACNGRVSRSKVVDALWDGQRISQSRFPNLLADLRARIGRHHLPEMRDGCYELCGVTTDLILFEEAVQLAQQDHAAAADHLGAALELVTGVPLTTPGGRFWTWVDDQTHLAARIETRIADVATSLAELQRDAGDLRGARWACERGLRGSPDDEALVALLADVYRALGKPGSARRLLGSWSERISRLSCPVTPPGARR